MQPEPESFEEAQRRLTGTSQGTWHLLSSRVKRIKWRKVFILAAFITIPLAIMIYDVFGGRDVPPYVLAIIVLSIFLVAATFIAFRESAKVNNRRKET